MQRIETEKINDIKINPLPVPKIDTDKIKGSELFPEIYSNIFLIAKKKSGKTNVISNIIDKCAGKKTTVIIFASTFYRDDAWKLIEEMLIKKKIEYIPYISIYDGKINQVAELTIFLEGKDIQKDKKGKQIDLKKIFSFNDDPLPKEKKEKKEKKLAPEYIIIFDDLSKELQDKYIGYLLKRNRHFKAKVIISTQYLNDLAKDARLQIDYLLLFPKLPEEKVEQIYKLADLSLEYDLFQALYENATSEKYNFLFIDTKNEFFRHNFNILYKL